ncbi:PspA/IM30 family protein [Luteolibacter flavescens]|uniref:PspA/IM30 family protein n=1 Tax=Luteolibacter flavescens TaxID=1859460 RepID=A0ABT3FVP4_9BACT|nr:PspA/IM30 family protein [Luteolibacter flavescens]MCW1887658.1 PspA/IM30 family protein [Luteolibacter flavescens]
MFRRIANLFKGFLGLFIGGIEKKNPEALLEVEKENLRKQISEFNQGLAAHAGLVERLMGQVKKLNTEETELKAKTKALLQAGQREAAAEMALRYQTVDKQHEDLAKQLESADTRYKELVRARDVAVKAARDKIESLRRGIDDMKVQKAMAELNEMAAGMVGSLGGSGDTLNRLEEMVEDERSKAAGRARVARDSVDMSGTVVKEAEQKALADMALADFAAAEGIELQPKQGTAASEAPPAQGQGTMGPVSQ